MQQLSMKRSAVKLANVLFLSLPLLALGACQQGEGDFCQVTVDCADGLECNAGTQRCQKVGSGGGGFDAAPVVTPDASVVDAAPVDATVFDASPPDASTLDADLPDGSPPT